MPEMTIRLITDPQTGKKDIIVKLNSDEDSLPHEHEQMHRQLVEKLIEGGAMQASEVGKIVIEREEGHSEGKSLGNQNEQDERQSHGEGS